MSISVKLFTHTDCDGVGCSVVAQVVFKGSVDVEYCNYEDVDERVLQFVKSHGYKGYDLVLITDISVREDVAEEIEKHCSDKTQLIDHHPTAEWLNKYSWARVWPKEQDIFSTEIQPSSGTSLLYAWCRENKFTQDGSLLGFVEAVRQYDTWEWKTRFGGNGYPKNLNDLLTLMGRYRFVNRWVKNQKLAFTESEKLILDLDSTRKKTYIANCEKRMREVVLPEGYKVGVVFAEDYHSELGNKLAEDNPHLDFIILVKLSTSNFSYRGVSDRVHLGQYAATKGGGGHPRAAGSPISEEAMQRIVNGLLLGKW